MPSLKLCQINITDYVNKIATDPDTIYSIQIAKDKKSKYETKHAYRGNLIGAMLRYNIVDLKSGNKKRLIASNSKTAIVQFNS